MPQSFLKRRGGAKRNFDKIIIIIYLMQDQLFFETFSKKFKNKMRQVCFLLFRLRRYAVMYIFQVEFDPSSG
jgi:abortive infection bacteriophage resistance protein